MTPFKTVSTGLLTLALFAAVGCSDRAKSPDVSGDVRHALDQAGLNDVGVSQDRDKGVVTLTGKVASDDDKTRAESITKSLAGNQVVADEIAVRPSDDASTARKVDSDLDSAIEKNLDAILVQHKWKKDVSYDVKNGVVTLKGDAVSQSERATVEKMAGQVPNVKQVVNEMDVKHQKATSSK